MLIIFEAAYLAMNILPKEERQSQEIGARASSQGSRAISEHGGGRRGGGGITVSWGQVLTYFDPLRYTLFFKRNE